MSLLRGEMLQVVAQSMGLEKLSSGCVQELLPEVELRVREVIQDALKFRRHAKHAQLSTAHVNHALRARNVEPLYGFGATQHLTQQQQQQQQPQTKTHASSGTGTGSGGSGAAAGMGGATGVPAPRERFRQCESVPTLFFMEDEELVLADLLNASLPPLPTHPVLHTHWLAVDGVPALVPENETLADDSTCHTGIKDESFVGDVERKPLVKHVLTEEMQLYFAKVTDAVKSLDAELQRAAFASLARDPSIHQLLPYFSRFIYEEVKHSNRDLPLLFSLMRVSRCLLENQSLRIELYLHQLLPAVLTGVLGKQLCENPADDHWALREYAAHLVAQICDRFGESYPHIQARVSKTFHQAITDPLCPFPTQYGALYGMMYLGPLVLENLLFPNLEQYYKRLEPALSSANPNLVERLEAQNCLGILVHASGMYFSMAQARSTDLTDIAGLLTEAFGERLTPYTSQFSAPGMLSMCL